MTGDPFYGLYQPVIAIRPRAEFTTGLRERFDAALGLAPPPSDEPTAEAESGRSVTFALHYRNVDAALRWVDRVLDLRAEWVHPESGPVRHAGLRWGDGFFSINTRRGIYELGPGAVVLTVADAAEFDRLHDRATAAHADVARPPAPDHDGRSRTFTVRDPEGTLWELRGPLPS